MIKLYKILTYILQPIGFIVLMMCLTSLMMSISNPQFLLFGAAGICVFLYTFFCFRFTIRSVVANQPAKIKLKDWIKVNAYVTIIQAILMLFLIVVVLFFIPKDVFDSTFKNMYEMLQQQPGQTGIGSYDSFVSSVRTMFGVMGVIESMLIVHVVLTFKMLKGYQEYFNIS